MKISFKNDYSEGCHPRVLEALTKTNLVQQDGYGFDEYSKKAANLILEKTRSPRSKVFFISGGTQANLVVASAFLRPHESVISANTGHIFDNETGAVEATGHKVNSAETADGKLTPEDIQQILDAHPRRPHQLKQRMVYISNSTEIGTIYFKDELKKLWEFCQLNDLYLYMDGARLGQALAAEDNDLSLEDVAKYTDAFYWGGTKNGALIGEAIIINNRKLQEDFEYHLKQKGAMLSKSRLLGIQFQELLKDDLYFELAKHANEQAMRIKEALNEAGVDWWAETTTNQIFPILENEKIEALSKNFDFYIWRKINEEQSAIRIITSWATREEHVKKFIEEIEGLNYMLA
ncbi:MAG: aminotransferase class I/II-fold pyridoxal phosphate-dependent enzyme [Anaerolineae bacterium]|jgi:threonine aldolase|nr:aminotransferase class I/II-fold pyridoxal phosphate-dependent enzyme [Anaerolineae bacterium]MBT7069829.1 aminotransferase class I/II-fold pyridoxal phosphate-dependent enzyme [Anaerolineae bacterium]MBT7782055.1 aminotransferase class I/II-fold pyridoxal phosphate-dependent enzyme [Anaerolineae bacterium]